MKPLSQNLARSTVCRKGLETADTAQRTFGTQGPKGRLPPNARPRKKFASKTVNTALLALLLYCAGSCCVALQKKMRGTPFAWNSS